MFPLKITRHKTEYRSFSMSHGGHIGVQVFQTSHVGSPKNSERNELLQCNLDLTRVRYIENLDLMNFWENNHNVCYIEVKLMINFQRPAFPNLEIFYNKHLHTKLLCQF